MRIVGLVEKQEKPKKETKPSSEKPAGKKATKK